MTCPDNEALCCNLFAKSGDRQTATFTVLQLLCSINTILAGGGGVGDLVQVTSVVPGVGATNLGKADQQVYVAGDVGVLALSRRIDIAASSAAASGEYAVLNTDANGKLWTRAVLDTGTNSIGKISDITTSVVPGTAATNLGKAEDAAHVSADTGVASLVVRQDNDGTARTDTDGDYINPVADSYGRLKVSLGSPFIQQAIVGQTYGSNGTVTSVGSTTTNILSTSANPKVGHLVIFGATSIARAGASYITAVSAGVSFTVSPPLPVAPNNGDFFYLSLPQPQAVDSTGQTLTRLKDSSGADVAQIGNAGVGASQAGVLAMAKMLTGVFVAGTTTNARATWAVADQDGRIAVNPYGSNVGQFFSAVSATDVTGTGSTTVAAADATNRHYVNQVTVRNTSNVASSYDILDDTTVLYTGFVAGPGADHQTFPTPLRGTVNKAVNIQMAITATATKASLSGFLSAN